MSAAPTFTPSTLNCTLDTATASLALALRVMLPFVLVLAVGEVMLTVGAVGAAILLTLTVMAALVVLKLLVFVATAVRLCDPLATVLLSQETVYGLVVSAAPMLAPSTLNCTFFMPIVSVAVAFTVTVPLTFALAAGADILMVGGVGVVADPAVVARL